MLQRVLQKCFIMLEAEEEEDKLQEVHFHVLEVQVLKVTQEQLIAVLNHVLLIQMLQKMLDVAFKPLVLK